MTDRDQRAAGRRRLAPPRAPIPDFSLPPELPISAAAAELTAAIRERQVIVVCGETGSGKTTQLPKLCLRAGRGREGLIGHTQPRRIAATSVARRLAQELGTEPGQVVGCQTRFNDSAGPSVSVKLMTDGILLAETRSDPGLRRYDTIIIDEAHERSVNIDFLLGYLRRLLPRRPELRLIITSATIDAERFAAHFADPEGRPAPIFRVDGRVFPVEIRWRPAEAVEEDDDRTLMEAIVDAVDEARATGPGDILVFLPGEREIREAADALRRATRPGELDILPLYARLAAEEQERVFRRGETRRAILATNVAETSITVPGIRFVVDSGLARIKRYSLRNKVEQLLVEPISQASAAQRAGRCGRVAAGVCLRLYDERDWARRPAFTDPEILRSNLAAVILRMKSLRLGEVADFPFLQAPSPRAVSDGCRLLRELNAVDDDGELTKIGRELARLPLDPRLGRVLLAARERGALAEALIIVAGLSAGDPRDRPLERAAAADEAQRIFSDPRSDFLSWLRIWSWYEEQRHALDSRWAVTAALRSRFLSARRLHEWRAIWRELSELVSGLGWRPNSAPADYEALHRALLCGLLGHVGLLETGASPGQPPYLGARGIHFWLWPGSGLGRKAVRWLVAAELAQTGRLYARCAAEIEPEWLETEAAHLLRRSWSEPRWEKKRGETVALERGTVYGLPVYAQRRVSLARHDPKLARELFIRQGLVAGDYAGPAEFLRHNLKLWAQLRELEDRRRRPDILVDEEELYALYDSRLPPEALGQASLEAWLKGRPERDRSLRFSRADLVRRDAGAVSAELFPKTLTAAGQKLALSYRFDPGSELDGVTLTVPIYALNQLDEAELEWLVPGLLRDKIQALVKTLPPRFRRHCQPLPDYVTAFLETVSDPAARRAGLLAALLDDLRRRLRLPVEREDFRLEQLPRHLLFNLRVIDEDGRQLAGGRNLAELRGALAARARDSFQRAARADRRVAAEAADHITSWSFGELPELIEIERGSRVLLGHPALVDRGDHCSLEVFDDPGAARQAHAAGLRRLFLLGLREQAKFTAKSLDPLRQAQLRALALPCLQDSFASGDELRDDLLGAAVADCVLAPPWPTDAASFEERRQAARGRFGLIARELTLLLSECGAELADLARALPQARAWPEVGRDIEEQLREMFPRHFLLSLPVARLKHYPRYLKAILWRLEKLPQDPERDARASADIARLTAPWRRELAARRGVADERLEEFRWLLAELRVSLFAQRLRTPVPVSVRRLEKFWAALRGL